MTTPETYVVLVDEQDAELGRAEKLAAHRAGQLHRAFSVFLFNERGEWLLQRRAQSKYHSGGLWSNTCCSHPAPGESTRAAAERRLREELGITCALDEVFSFRYDAVLDGGMTEREYDHVFVGRYSGEPTPDPAEVDDWAWVAPAEVRAALDARPEDYTVWFRQAAAELWARGIAPP